MATLRGQNFRILATGLDDSGVAVIGMSTNCTVTLTNNTEDASTKDDVGLASKPTVNSKSWQVSVESLNVVDMAALLTVIKSMQSIQVMWDEVATTNNQNLTKAAFSRVGYAYLSDATFTFNDRENSVKSLQFTGASALETIDQYTTAQVLSAGTYTKGQFVRLFLGSDNTTTPAKVIAAAKQLSFHVSITLEDATTKDTDGEWQRQEPTGLSYDISTNALMRSGESITSSVQAQGLSDLETIYTNGTPVKFQIANVSGDNQRTKGSVIVSGSVICSQLTLNAPNRQIATYDAQLQGYGEYTVSA